MSELEASLSCSPQCAETHCNKNTGDINPETVQITNTNNSQVEKESQRDSDLKNLLTESYCHVCEATLLYESQRVSHYEGKKHAQKVRLYLQNKKAERNKQTQECGGFMRGLSADPDKFCELCNMVFSSHTVAKSHYEGKVHAKNLRRTNPPQIIVSTSTLESASPVAQPAEVAVSNRIDQEQDSSGVGDQEVDLSDPNKYCALCNASFNNPVVAQQHYSGRKHQRNETRQQMLDQIGDQSEHVSSLTCPICCLTLSSIEMYQAHMQGNKHQLKEKKVMELCKSQKKVYDSYQDELADYIQVQKARGLEPKAGLGTVGQASKDLDETINESPQTGETTPHPAPLLPPPRGFHQPHWPPQLQSQVNHFGFGMRGPVPHYQTGYMPQPLPHFIPGQLYKRGRSPDSHSSSSYSDFSSSYASSSSSSSSSDSSSSRERRRRKRKLRKQGIKRRDQVDESDTDRRGRDREEKKKSLKGDRIGSVEGEEDKETRRWKEKRKMERSQSEDEESRSKRRQSKRRRRHGDGQHAKRRKEAELMEKEGVEVQGKSEEPAEEKAEAKDVKQKHKKDKKKGKEKVNQEDNRTEEERLWDETILGIF